MNDKDVAIVTASDANYLPAACCQLVSSAAHLGGMTNVQLFLVVCDVSEQDLRDARGFFRQRGIPVEIVEPDFVDEIATLKTRWPRAAYLRLYFDRIFDGRWKRVIYFDADTRVSASLVPLVQADLQGHPVGAVHDFILYVTGNIHRRRRDLFLANDAPYLQSGVMVFDWPHVLAGDDLAAARRFLAEHPEACYEAPDQDALNATFENRWTPLDPRWNLHEIYLMYGKVLKPHLRHFTSAKPWASNRPRAWREASAWYKAELAHSPWPAFVENQNFLQATQADLKFLAKRYYPQIRERLVKLLPASLGQKLPKGRYMPWVPRRAQDVEDMASALIREAEGTCPPLRPPEAALPRGQWQAAT